MEKCSCEDSIEDDERMDNVSTSVLEVPKTIGIHV